MTYDYITSYNSPNYTPKSRVPAVFGMARNIQSITIHHWGDPKNKPRFDGIVSWLCRPNGNSSAHYVVESEKVACIIDPDNAAWHAGNRVGNATSIGIELNPREQDGDYVTAGELIAKLRDRYGDLPLVPHRHWVSTDCPGTYDLVRLDKLARGDNPDPTPPKPRPGPAKLTVDGLFGENTIRRGQEIMGTVADGKINDGYSPFVAAVQTFLNAKGARDENGNKLKVDGICDFDNTTSASPKQHTIAALERYLRTPVDAYLSCPSTCVKQLQRAFNNAKTGSKEF